MKTAAPTYMQIEPVGQCNLRCQMCPIQFRKDGPPYGPAAFMKDDVFRRIIDGSPGLAELHLQGLGEPMMHPRFFDMVSYAAGKGIKVSTNTNLTLLNPARAEKCVDSGLDYIHVSLDGATAATYERIRLRARFDVVLRNLGYLLAAREKSAEGTPHLRLVTVVMRQNLHELPGIVRLAGRFKIPALFVQHLAHDFQESGLPAHYAPMRAFVQEQTLLGEDPERVRRFFDEASRAAAALGVDLRLPRTSVREHAPGVPGPDRCDWPWKGPYISYQGYAMPCCMVATPDRIQLGDIGKEGVERVWNGKAYRAFREQLASERPPDVCRSCSVYSGTF
jgi:radical SAM protein with 4Fe4S-binding SPASM domain